MTYSIKVTGSGTQAEIISALNALIKSISTDIDKYAGTGPLEDETLCTEIEEADSLGNPIPCFVHPDLSSDWRQCIFSDEEEYIKTLDKRTSEPENFAMRIYEVGASDNVWEYLYDNKEDAEKDWKTFCDNIKATRN